MKEPYSVAILYRGPRPKTVEDLPDNWRETLWRIQRATDEHKGADGYIDPLRVTVDQSGFHVEFPWKDAPEGDEIVIYAPAMTPGDE